MESRTLQRMDERERESERRAGRDEAWLTLGIFAFCAAWVAFGVWVAFVGLG